MADVDVGDLLDYLAADSKTGAILMYLEQVTNARKFMSAARAAARVKPVIVIKSGRHAQSAKAAKSHTGALAGEDTVYEAAFRRAGIIRVEELEDLFDTAEMLRHNRLSAGEQLAIVTNGGGAGVLATDRLLDFGGALAGLSPNTMSRLDAALPPTWSRGNPVDIIGDADAKRYEDAMDIVLGDAAADAVLVMHCPTALASSEAAADAVIAAVRKCRSSGSARKAVLAAWLGDRISRDAQRKFEAAGISSYTTAEDAVRGFIHLTRYYKAQEALMRTPPALPDHLPSDRKRACDVVAEALARGTGHLSEREAKILLTAYGIPAVPSNTVRRWDEVEQAADGFLKAGAKEVVVKILSADVLHKSDAGGVALSLPSAQAAGRAAAEMFTRIRKAFPAAAIDGFIVQPMVRRGHAREVILGVAEDITFGPVILFGAGGTAVEVIRDRAVALPPLDMHLARDLIAQTQVARTLRAYRNQPAADIDAVALTLVRLSQMVADIPEIHELDINPLLVDDKGVLALDARVLVRPAVAGADGLNPCLVIRPYPQRWAGKQTLRNGAKVQIRPIRPEDERLYETFLAKTSDEDLRLRLFSAQQQLTHEFLARLTQIDYARSMAFVAVDDTSGELLGVSRFAADPDHVRAEFALIVRSDRQGEGIGFALMQHLIEYAEAEAIGELWAYVLLENERMLHLCSGLGFAISRTGDDLNLSMAKLSLPRQTAAAAPRLTSALP